MISLTSLSHKTYCSRNYLSTVFREKLGTDFKSYLQDFRMKKAAKLLLENQYTLSAIAEKVGYHDIKTFRKIFEKHYGMLPSEFRQNNSWFNKKNSKLSLSARAYSFFAF